MTEELGIPDKYKPFFEKLKNINQDTSKWKTNDVLGYFILKYKQTYNTDYQFKFNTEQPSKCFELFQIKKLSSILSKDPFVLKNYIDYIFANQKRKFISISYLTNDKQIFPYKKSILTPTRSTRLPQNFIDLLKNYSLETYGDLAFLYMVKEDNKEIFSILEKNGFNINILSEIK